MKPIISEGWYDYKLIDSGGREKLEKFGKYILRRPEPQALWSKALEEKIWQSKQNACFIRDKKTDRGRPEISGYWKVSQHMPEEWPVNIKINRGKIQLILKRTSSGHIGIFPEQYLNWHFVAENTARIKEKLATPRVLNLFAYTGAASLASLSAGGDVVHVDSVKQTMDWTEKNRENSILPKSLHLVVEDALKFLKRESNRKKIYNGIILDPPVYGRGPEGEKWVLEENIFELMSYVARLLDKDLNFFLMNWYSIGLSAYVMENIVREFFPGALPEFGEMIIQSGSGNHLPLGTYLRFNT